MTRTNARRFARLFSRRAGVALLWTAVVVGAAVVVNLAGIHLIGSVDGWEHWLQTHAGFFFAWRVCLYAATAWGWWWMRQRVRQREPTVATRQRFIRIEVAAVTAIVLMEASVWLKHG